MTTTTEPWGLSSYSAALDGKLADSRTGEDRDEAYNWFTANVIPLLPHYGDRSTPQSTGRPGGRDNPAASIDRVGFQLRTLFEPQREVGGDWFDRLADRGRER